MHPVLIPIVPIPYVKATGDSAKSQKSESIQAWEANILIRIDWGDFLYEAVKGPFQRVSQSALDLKLRGLQETDRKERKVKKKKKGLLL